MGKFALLAIILFVSGNSYADNHASSYGSRTRYGKTTFFNQSFMGFSGQITKEGDAEVYGEKKVSISGKGVKSGLGLEAFKFLQLSIYHTMVDQESNSTALEHTNGSEIGSDLSLSFSSPVGNLGFGLGVNAASISMQNNERSGQFMGRGDLKHLSWTYFFNPSLSFHLRYETSKSKFKRDNGDIGVDSFTLKREGLGIGFKVWM